ncbi:Na(+)-translocating NADH-quinone reductase subunit D [Planctomycetes bacterium Pan216]|uniref:Na(+)-translocating NADH-quinone reductase subunit D n=1 Tax=Kolteria novifilia TaxID=2527975 RepID=A0A518AYB7_9BACT|nr:Na(+)-translocating NADH-quinone reductase subunit D [Planctomycetes bacterium Pan216]
MATLIDKIPGLAQLSKKDREIVVDPLWDNNPITLQVLGICSALAVTTKVQPALVMSAALVFVLTMSNVVISVLRNYIPSKVRMIVELAVISSLVIIIDEFLKAFLFDVAKELSVFVSLIVTNCIVMGRAEAYAMANGPFRSALDGIGNALGYGVILLLVASGREILGGGTWFGLPVVPQFVYDAGYVNVGLMLLPPGAFILLGLIIWVQRSISGKVID